MESIPLHCNICPKHPDFSDISHLLTHIGSKGHLSHYFKAQVRGRQDAAVRQQLDTYDRWYTEHQIEQLLSQRMVLKDSKRANGIARAVKKEQRPSTKPPKAPRASRKKVKPTVTQALPDTTNSENVIDPQLSQSVSTPVRHVASPLHSPSLSSPGFDLATLRRNPPPPMRTFRTPGSTMTSATKLTQQLLIASTANANASTRRRASMTESSNRHIARLASPQPVYPEPPTIEGLASSTNHASHPSTTLPRRRGRPKQKPSWTEEDSPAEESFLPQTPELKGFYYPGMSLFDSASLEAQRKRNQRKGDTLVAQIERESLDVECNEYIYWPDGSLKMCRFITGDPQSSPVEGDTPPPPPPKRGRAKKPRAANAKGGRRKSRKDTAGDAQEMLADSLNNTAFIPEHLQYPIGRSLTPDSWSLGQALRHAHTPEEEEEWLLNMGEPTLRRRRPAAETFGTEPDLVSPFEEPSRAHTEPFTADYAKMDSNNHGPVVGGHLSQDGSFGSTTHETFPKVSPPKRSGHSGVAMHARSCAYSVASHDKENIPPAGLFFGAKQDNVAPDCTKSVQRYYTTTENQGSRVSSNLPAEMAFAGMPTPPVYRVSLNPLNPNAHLRQSLPYSPYYSPFEMPQPAKKASHASQSASLGQAQ
ncbi:MAG: hypothetical protein LQ350_007602 [Teloschistes chrysophthalmus]|nr:MAG: hypothetical protein LQ350_007602 [Niorma chrysophthalma]